MVAIAVTAVFLYAILTAAVGVRLLWVGYRTRDAPPLLLGACYLFGGVLGWAFIVLGVACQESMPLVARSLGYVGLLCFSGGLLCIARLCWRVFSPRSPWARTLFWLLTVVLLVEYVHNVGITGVPFPPTRSIWWWPGMIGRTAIIAWVPVASLTHHRRLRLRLALGLADPQATNRMLLWGLSGTATFVATVIVVIATLAGPLDAPYGESRARPPIIMLVVALAAFSAILSVLAFLPPRRYLAWVEARARRSREVGEQGDGG